MLRKKYVVVPLFIPKALMGFVDRLPATAPKTESFWSRLTWLISQQHLPGWKTWIGKCLTTIWGTWTCLKSRIGRNSPLQVGPAFIYPCITPLHLAGAMRTVRIDDPDVYHHYERLWIIKRNMKKLKQQVTWYVGKTASQLILADFMSHIFILHNWTMQWIQPSLSDLYTNPTQHQTITQANLRPIDTAPSQNWIIIFIHTLIMRVQIGTSMPGTEFGLPLLVPLSHLEIAPVLLLPVLDL